MPVSRLPFAGIAAPLVPIVSTPIVTISSNLDTMWPPHMLRVWQDIAHAGYEQTLVQGVSHFRLMTSLDVVNRTIAELAVAAAAKVSGGSYTSGN